MIRRLRDDVLPRLALTSSADGGVADAKRCRHDAEAEPTVPDPQHVGFAEFRGALAASNGEPATIKGLARVLHVGAERQMGRLNADRPITRVKNVCARRDWADESAVRLPVRCDHVRAGLHPESAISVAVQAPSPIPADVRWGRLAGHEPCEHFVFPQSARPLRRLPSQRVAISAEAPVVRAAHIRGMDPNGAAGNTALSHARRVSALRDNLSREART